MSQLVTGFSADKRLLFENAFNEVKQNWEEKRNLLGYDAKIAIDIPAEFYELKVIEKRICSQDETQYPVFYLSLANTRTY